jgi:GTP-binding protein
MPLLVIGCLYAGYWHHARPDFEHLAYLYKKKVGLTNRVYLRHFLVDPGLISWHYVGMKITSAKFLKGIVGPDEAFADGTPQIAFIGRSNVGKSSVINSLTQQKDLARTSSFPGRTQELNLFLINNSFYLVDLPGYGYAKMSFERQEKLQRLIGWYLFESPYRQKKVVLIIDGKVGPTDNDQKMLETLEEQGKDVVILMNKVDKLKKMEYATQLLKVKEFAGKYPVIPYSSKKRIGIGELTHELLDKTN